MTLKLLTLLFDICCNNLELSISKNKTQTNVSQHFLCKRKKKYRLSKQKANQHNQEWIYWHYQNYK